MAAVGSSTYPCQLVFVGTTDLSPEDVAIGVEVVAQDLKTIGSICPEATFRKARLLPCCNDCTVMGGVYPQNWSDRFSTASPQEVTAKVIVVARSAVVSFSSHTLFDRSATLKEYPVTILSKPEEVPGKVGVLVVSKGEAGFVGQWEQRDQVWDIRILYSPYGSGWNLETGLDQELVSVAARLESTVQGMENWRERKLSLRDGERAVRDHLDTLKRITEFQPALFLLRSLPPNT